MVQREQLGNVILNNWKIRKQINLSYWFFTQPYGFVEGSLTLVFCQDWQYCQYSVIFGSIFYHQDQGLKLCTEIKKMIDKMRVEIRKKENTLKVIVCVCARASIFKWALKVPFLQDIYLTVCNCVCIYISAYIYIYVHTCVWLYTPVSGLAEETNLHDPA